MTPEMALRDAERALREQRHDDCERLCLEVLARQPRNLPATVLLGISRTRRGDPQAALEPLWKGVQLGPDSFEAWLWLGIAQKDVGRTAEAIRSLEKSARLAPGNPNTLRTLGLAHLDQSNGPAAVACLRDAVAAGARDAATYHQLAVAYQAVGDTARAVKSYQKALALDPKSADSWVMLGNLYLETARREEAISAFLAAHRLNPDTARGQIQLARAYREQGRLADAEEALGKAQTLEPDNTEALELISNLMQQMGRFGPAKEAIERAIELNPDQPRFYLNRTSCARTTEADRPLVARMAALAAREHSLEGRRNLHYALGKAYDDLGDPEAAMRHYDAANEAMRGLMGGRPFDREAHRTMFDRKIATYTREWLERNRSAGDPSKRPFFIVGMIRSGTSLTEQILSAHPQVAGGGEVPYWFERSRGKIGPTVALDGSILAADRLKELQEGYLELLEEIGGDRERTTDKMPNNYLFLGDLHLLFPNAKIVHCRRHPVDNCISIYTTPYRGPLDFAHDKANIVFVYREYLRLMEHWRSVLPPESMLEVDYEALVDHREAETRRMVEFLGLPWDDACLAPESNERVVRTPSLWQVRQPIYRSSVERWRRFEPWLEEFGELF
ncbi:MAG TPA: sulfotransferase [Fimbriimonas sp.]